MKVLFLDIDGVVNTLSQLTAHARVHGNLAYICPKRMELVREIVDATGCVVVLSSNWRKWPEMKAVVDTAASVAGFQIFDVTTDNPDLGRTGEIAAWHHLNNVTTYAILDDLSLDDYNLFQTDDMIGLTRVITDRVIAHLKTHD